MEILINYHLILNIIKHVFINQNILYLILKFKLLKHKEVVELVWFP